jgi:hypothetical protein
MVPIPQLLLPILVASVLVFVASSVIHMFMGYHRADWKPLPNEDAVMDALRASGVPAGDFVMPYAASPEAMKSEAFQQKARTGPSGFMTILPPGRPLGMGKQLTQWFVYCVVVSVFCAYIAGRVVGPGADYLEVFRFAGFTGFACYAVAGWQRSIWYAQSWSTTARNTFDGLVYGLLTAGTFGWLWPS